MSGSSAYVIVGAGLAGAKAAEALREEGFDGPVVLIGDEAERPYERPPLSKEYLMGKAERETIYVHRGVVRGPRVELRLGVPVTGIDRAAHQVALADGSRIGYARLLLATGASPRRSGAGRRRRRRALPAPGRRQRPDPGRLPDRVAGRGHRRWLDRPGGRRRGPRGRRRGHHPGGGRAPAAAGARARGRPGLRRPAPRARRRPPVRRPGQEISGAGGGAAGCGWPTAAGRGRRGGGRVGITPNSQLAGAAGLEAENGIVVDQGLRTSDPDIFAAGDVASAYHPLLGGTSGSSTGTTR